MLILFLERSVTKLDKKVIFDYLVDNGYLKIALSFDEELMTKQDLDLIDISSHELQPTEKMVPIKDIMKEKKNDIEKLKNDGTEIYKVLNYIMKSGLEINKQVIEATKVKNRITLSTNEIRVNPEIYENFKCIKQGRFSRFGVSVESEEALILKALDELMSKTSISDYKILLTDFSQVLKPRWHCEFLGMLLCPGASMLWF